MTSLKLEGFRESGFWERLDRYPDGDKAAIEQLEASVSQVAEQASYIGELIWRYLPQYTLHGETHNLNVLAIMDRLTPDEVMDKLTPLECALCIMAAYTHDLGMALTEEEHCKILDKTGDTPERQSFLRYRDGALDLNLGLALGLGRARAFLQTDPSFQQCIRSSVFQEAFWPDLSRSFPMLSLFHLRGVIGDAMIVGPGLVELDMESDGCTVHPMDLQGKRPEEVARLGYDLVFPMTSVPLGELRRQCPCWRSDRRYRPLGVAPFLFPGLDELWAKQSEELLLLFKVERIFALLPRMELWSKPFAQWTDEDWETCGLSALWDIRAGRVLWAKGAHHVDKMEEVGKPAEEFLKENG